MSKLNIKKLQDFLDSEQNVNETVKVIRILQHYGFTKDFDKDFTMSELVEHCLFDLQVEKNEH